MISQTAQFYESWQIVQNRHCSGRQGNRQLLLPAVKYIFYGAGDEGGKTW